MEKLYLEDSDYDAPSPFLKIALLTGFIGFALNAVASPLAFGSTGQSHHLDKTVQAMTIMPLILAFIVLILIVIIMWLPQMDHVRVFWTKVGGAASFLAAILLVAGIIVAGLRHEIKAGTSTDYPTTFVILASVTEVATGILMMQATSHTSEFIELSF